MARLADKRETILAAALEVFGAKGYAAASVPEVARAAGIAPGTIYIYFKDKAELVNVLYRHWKAAKVDAVTLGNAGQTPRERFRNLWYSYVEFGLQNAAGLMFLENHYHQEYLDEESRALTVNFVANVIAFVEEMVAAGAFKKALPQVLMAIFHGAAREIILTILQHGLEATPEVLAQAEQCCWEAVRA